MPVGGKPRVKCEHPGSHKLTWRLTFLPLSQHAQPTQDLQVSKMLTPLRELLFATNAVPHTTVQENPRELNATGVGRTLLSLTGDSVENVRLFQISILGYDSILDLDRRVVSIEWVISECRDQKLTTQNPRATFGGSPPCSPPNRTIDVYLNK